MIENRMDGIVYRLKEQRRFFAHLTKTTLEIYRLAFTTAKISIS